MRTWRKVGVVDSISEAEVSLEWENDKKLVKTKVVVEKWDTWNSKERNSAAANSGLFFFFGNCKINGMAMWISG